MPYFINDLGHTGSSEIHNQEATEFPTEFPKLARNLTILFNSFQ